MIALGKVITECEVYEFSRSRIGKLVKKHHDCNPNRFYMKQPVVKLSHECFSKNISSEKKQKDPVISQRVSAIRYVFFLSM